jgi:hypothetical protein
MVATSVAAGMEKIRIPGSNRIGIFAATNQDTSDKSIRSMNLTACCPKSATSNSKRAKPKYGNIEVRMYLSISFLLAITFNHS